MTGPADDADLVVKMLNSGAPGVMLDLEDSMANNWSNLQAGIHNILEALRGDLTYFDQKRRMNIGINPSNTVIWLRPRGLHMSQAGVLPDQDKKVAASLFRYGCNCFSIDPTQLKHPLSSTFRRPNPVTRDYGGGDVFQAFARAKGLPEDYIKCMALVESLRPGLSNGEVCIYTSGTTFSRLNLGRWDFTASLIHFNLYDPQWVLPTGTRSLVSCPFQRLRQLLVDICHKHTACSPFVE